MVGKRRNCCDSQAIPHLVMPHDKVNGSGNFLSISCRPVAPNDSTGQHIALTDRLMVSPAIMEKANEKSPHEGAEREARGISEVLKSAESGGAGSFRKEAAAIQVYAQSDPGQEATTGNLARQSALLSSGTRKFDWAANRIGHRG